jgi:hypothetical protein
MADTKSGALPEVRCCRGNLSELDRYPRHRAGKREKLFPHYIVDDSV